MDHGRIVHHGNSDWLRQHPELIEQYLGIAA
jgi:ABC-type branched-subunit amino acid transport system ATPase component